MKHLFLGIDLGTSTMKLVLMDETKKVLDQRTEDYQSAELNKGWSEIAPQLWYDCMIRGIREILKGVDTGLVAGIGVTGQMHTLVVVDEDGSPIRPAIMWNDTRTKEFLPELRQKMQTYEEGEYLSRTISTGSPAANLYWLSRYEPENFKRIHKFLIGPDYLVYRLTGRFGTDYCEASTSCLYQIKARKWSEQMRDLIGLSQSAYPPIRGSAVQAGEVCAELAEELCLGKGVQVLTGTGDNPATAISTGCLSYGYPVISLGTSGVIMLARQGVEENTKGKVILFSFDGKQFSYLVQGAVQSNGSTFSWWIKKIMDMEDFSGVDRIVDIQKSAANQLLFYPHLMGDKTIYGDPDLRGAFLGLSPEYGKSDMIYAVVEGLCFAFRELAEKMQMPTDNFESIKVVGGGANSEVWMQTLANVFHKKVEQLDGNVGAAFGIALLAAHCYGCVEAIGRMPDEIMQIKRFFEPDSELHMLYEKKYRTYLRIHEGLAYIYQE